MFLDHKSGSAEFKQKGYFFNSTELWLLPGELTRHQLKHDLLASCKNEQGQAVILAPQIFTIGRLEKLLSLEIQLEPVISDWSRNLLLNYLTHKFFDSFDLPPLKTSLMFQLAQNIGDVLARLTIEGLGALDILRAGRTKQHQGLASLFTLYEKLLKERGQIDHSQRRRRLLCCLTDGGTKFKTFRGVRKIISQRISRFSPFEIEFIKALGRHLEVDLILNMPAWVRDKNLAGAYGRELVAAINAFEAEGENSRLNLIFNSYPEAAQDQNSSEILALSAEYLLAPEKPELFGEAADHISINSVPSKYHEVEEAARQIKLLLLAGEAPLKLALAVPQLESYRPIIEDVGRRFGLKFHFRRGSPLLAAGPVLALFELLGFFSSVWEMERFINLCHSPYFSIFSPQKARELALKAGVSDDRAGGGFFDNLPLGPESGQLLQVLDKLKNFQLNLTNQDNWPSFIGALKEILKDLNWPSLNFQPAGDDVNNSWDKAAALNLEKKLSELEEILQDPLAPPVSLGNFIFWLENILAEVYLNIQAGQPESSIWAVNYYDLHGAQFNHIFFLGLNERSFPQTGGSSSFWSYDFRESFNALSRRKIWNSFQDNYRQEEEIFSSALFGAQEKVWLYYSREDLKRRPLLPSPLVRSLNDLWPGQNLETEKLWPQKLSARLAASSDERWQIIASLSCAPPEPFLSAWQKLKKRRKLADEQKNLASLGYQLYSQWLAGLKTYQGSGLVTASFLMNYAQCPLKFYYSYVLGLQEDGGSVEEWAQSSEGNLAHRVLEEFFTDKLNAPFPGRHDPTKLLQDLRDAFSSVTENFKEPKGRRPLWRIRHFKLWQNLEAWLLGQLQAEKNFVPLALEWAFGSDSVPPLKILLTEEGGEALYLKGRIDRLDEVNGSLRAVDYKLSYQDKYRIKRDKLLPPDSWPLALYSLAAENHWGQKTKGCFNFLKAGVLQSQLELPDSQSPDLTLDLRARQSLAGQGLFNLPEKLAQLWQDLNGGIFDPTATDSGEPDCNYCPYLFICSHLSL